jgi:hypothetical protein
MFGGARDRTFVEKSGVRHTVNQPRNPYLDESYFTLHREAEREKMSKILRKNFQGLSFDARGCPGPHPHKK